VLVVDELVVDPVVVDPLVVELLVLVVVVAPVSVPVERSLTSIRATDSDKCSTSSSSWSNRPIIKNETSNESRSSSVAAFPMAESSVNVVPLAAVTRRYFSVPSGKRKNRYRPVSSFPSQSSE
jgi:hypothetical protein